MGKKGKDSEETPSVIINNCAKLIRRHVGYHSSMITEGLVGIIEIDKDVAFYSVTHETEIAGFVALRRCSTATSSSVMGTP